MADLVGKQIGNYRLMRLLGRGGFASMYLAEHMFTKDQVTIKVLPSQMTGIDLENFLAEARLTSRLVHPHILRTLDFGMEEDGPFIVSAYAPNGSLRQRHPRGSMVPLASVVSYVRQVADALQYAHDQKFIHRDVKPENMLLGRNDEILLSDFDVAVLARSSISVSTVAGTPSPYVAPEQIQGKPRPASDQYSLGLVAYEWLSGTLPFRGSPINIIFQAMNTPPLSLRDKVPTIPPEVEQVVMRALAREPQQRFPKVRDFASSLENAYLSSLQNAFFIVRTSTGDDSRVYQLEEREIAIGRASSNDILLSEDKLVSRYHATVRYENANYILYDEGSANGTFVNGQPLEKGKPRILRDGDRVSIGKHELIFRTPTSANINVFPTSASPPNRPATPGANPTFVNKPGESVYSEFSPHMDTRAIEPHPQTIIEPPPLPAPTISKVAVGSSDSDQQAAQDDAAQDDVAQQAAQDQAATPWIDADRDTKTSLSDKDAGSQDSTKVLSLFAIARTKLEKDDRAFVGKVYSVEAGLSQRKPMPVERFEGVPFKLPLRKNIRFLFLDILLHTSNNIELITHWQRRLRYDSYNPEPQLVAFKFRVVAPGSCSLAIDFYYERRWLRTIHFKFDAVEQSQLTAISSEG